MLLAGSVAGVLVLVALARWLGFAADPVLADDAAARTAAEQALPGFRAGDVLRGRDGRAALVRGADGGVALVRPLGDRWVVRRIGPGDIAPADDGLTIAPNEAMFPESRLALAGPAPAWALRP